MRVLAVPRSIARSFENRPWSQSKIIWTGAGFGGPPRRDCRVLDGAPPERPGGHSTGRPRVHPRPRWRLCADRRRWNANGPRFAMETRANAVKESRREGRSALRDLAFLVRMMRA